MMPLALEISIYVALLAVVLAGLSSMYTSLVCLRELSSFDRQVMRIDSLIGRLEERAQNGGAQ
jgi:hypothetical protein